MLRQVLITVIYSPEFLSDLNLDESVLRAAHRALMRQQSGIIDSFLFVLCGGLEEEEALKAFGRYGFPEVSIACIKTKDEKDEEIDDTDIGEMISHKLRTGWLNITPQH